MRLTIVPFASVTGDLPREVARRLRGILPWRFVLAPSVPDPAGRGHTGGCDVALYWPLLPRSDRHDMVIVGLAACDLEVATEGSVFGYAAPERRAAVVSVSRLTEGTLARRGGRRLLVERTTKEMLHEAGHIMGLSHCDRSGCVMQYSQTLHDTDIKQARFCADCLKELSRLPEPTSDG